MNLFFLVAFALLTRYSKLMVLPVLSIIAFYIAIDDFRSDVICCLIASYAVCIATTARLKVLFFALSLLNLLAVLSSYYFDITDYVNDYVGMAAYFVYLSFAPVAVTINLMIIADVMRGNSDRIYNDMLMLYMRITSRLQCLFVRHNEKSTKEG